MTTDKQSTALQQLIQWLDPIHDSVIKKATELLEAQFTQQDKAAHTVTAWVWVKCSDRLPESPGKHLFMVSDGVHNDTAYFVIHVTKKDLQSHIKLVQNKNNHSWLEQVQLPVNGVNGYSLEEVEKAFDAGFNRGTYEACDIDELVIPKTKKQYIQSLKQR